jgi:hypothetical protein
VVVALVALAFMWGYILYLAIGPGRQPPVDRLDDPTFATRSEERCAQAVREVDALPLAEESASSEERADVIDRANDVFGSMLADLESYVPDGDDRRYAEEWLADWRLYFDDRERYAAALHDDPDARFLVSAKPGEGRHVTGWIDEFAKANRMPSCATPRDV